ncbi:phage tail protein [Thalassospira indica]|uniref:Phage tail fibre protein N-terminal domain-containing protein n=1 Tax=Thalassospira indica TaxID=1891279 RepID=A0ABN5NE41_9PROT|nr:phage tail protein [Thalassospira indica]AXO13769.1 hypothetical protein DY252_05685 [Thalassospira indica]
MSDYYTIFTNIGVAKMANALALGQSVVLTQFAVGDGGIDGDYNPTAAQTSLKNETYRAAVNAISVDPNNPSWLVVEAVIPANQGGWYVREAGLFDQDGDMIAIIRYPETFKPVLESGVGKDLYLRVILEHSNTELVELKIDPAIVLATRQFVGDSIDSHNADATAHGDLMAAHNGDGNAHPDFLRYNLTRTVAAGFWTTPVAATVDDGDVTLPVARGNRFTLTATDALTILAPDPIPAGGSARLELTIGSEDPLEISFGAGFKVNHGKINSDPNAVNLIHMEFNGTLIDVHITQRAEA